VSDATNGELNGKAGLRHVVLLCGGRSAEHEVSLLSVASVISHLDQSRFRVSVLGIRKDGSTMAADELRRQIDSSVAFTGVETPDSVPWVSFLERCSPENCIVFPVLHGPYGEDGTVQGALEVLGLPYVGASVGGSAVGMNKMHSKQILSAAGLPVVPGRCFDREDWRASRSSLLSEIDRLFRYPVFVKPVNLGSSVGISRCAGRGALVRAIDVAMEYDDWIIVEQGIDAREIEVSVLGSFSPRVSVPGEIRPSDVFYSYEAKYLSDASELIIPAPLEPAEIALVQGLAVDAFRALHLEGMARMDFLMDRRSRQFWINEPNTIPGFTRISMYPKLWEASGLPYRELLSQLIDLGLERHQRRKALKIDRFGAGELP
jgi:D-alanine-D-alanine ligase